MKFRVFKKIIYKFLVYILSFLDGRFSRFYMQLYLVLLKNVGVKINGKPRYISSDVYFDDFTKIYLNDRVVISKNVVFLSHDYSLTTAMISLSKKPETDIAFVKDIIIGNNVFIGLGAIIMPGTIVNDNVVVGAGTVLRGEIPSNSVVIGNPSKVIGKLSDKAEKWRRNMSESELIIDKY